MRRGRLWRDFLFGLIGAGIAVAAIELAGARGGRDPGPGPAAASGPGDLVAWTLASRAPGVELLGEARLDDITPCTLPTAGVLSPVLDEETRLPSRIAHWRTGGPRLWVMSLTREPLPGSPASRPAAHRGGAPCPDGRVLVPADTIMNFLYERSVERAAMTR